MKWNQASPIEVLSVMNCICKVISPVHQFGRNRSPVRAETNLANRKLERILL